MSRNSIGNKVARAAATGSRRKSSGSQKPIGWYGSLTLVVVLGVSVVGYSRYELKHPASATPPKIGTHWQAAVGFDVCGKSAPDLVRPKNAASQGLTTSGNGLIQISPKTASEAGANATLGQFVTHYPGLVVNATTLKLPGQPKHVNGQLCGGKPGQVRVETWSSLASSSPTLFSGNPSDLKFSNGEIIAIGFVRRGATLPEPASRFALVGGSLVPPIKNTKPTSGGSATKPATTTNPATTTKPATTTNPAATSTKASAPSAATPTTSKTSGPATG